MSQILPALAESSHQGLIKKLFSDSLRFILRSIIPPLLILFFSKKSLTKSRVLLMIYFLWFVVVHLLKNYDFTSFWYYNSGLIFAYVLFDFWNNKFKITQERILFLLVPCLIYLFSSIGTNNNLFKISSYGSLLLTPTIFYFLRSENRRIQNALITFFLALSIYGIFQKQYFQSYRSLPRDKQVFENHDFSPLKFIKIDTNLKKKLSSIEENLKMLGFEDQKITTYPNLPGVISYLGLTAFGNPWNNDNYINSDKANCVYVELESSQELIFVYSEKDLSKEFDTCLKRKSINQMFI